MAVMMPTTKATEASGTTGTAMTAETAGTTGAAMTTGSSTMMSAWTRHITFLQFVLKFKSIFQCGLHRRLDARN